MAVLVCSVFFVGWIEGCANLNPNRSQIDWVCRARHSSDVNGVGLDKSCFVCLTRCLVDQLTIVY
jgi:hypothetical protein